LMSLGIHESYLGAALHDEENQAVGR